MTTEPTIKLLEARIEELNKSKQLRLNQLAALETEITSHEMALKLINNEIAKQEALG